MNSLGGQLGAALLYALAGCGLFFMLLNRVLILIPDSRAKFPLILLSLIGSVAGGAVFGFFHAHLPWVLLPLAVLALVAIGEVRRFRIQRACAGSAPIDTVPHRFSWISPVTTTDLVAHRYVVPHPKWRGAPLRVVHLTDLHVHAGIPLAYYRDVIAMAEQLKPDIAVFTGDFITSVAALPLLKEVLRPVARLASFAVLGNHD